MRYKGNISNLDVIISCWHKECNGDDVGIDMSKQFFLDSLQELIDSDTDELLVLEDEEPIGLLGLTTFKSPLGNQIIANEHYWYVVPHRRGLGSLKLIKEAEKWARERGCSHLIMSASNLASDLHDTVCSIYERLGMTKFETSYIRSI